MKTNAIPFVLLAVIFLISMSSCITKPETATPFLNPPGGTYFQPQVVTIASSTLGVTIYYTLDGSEPKSSSLLYSEPISLGEPATIKAKAFRADLSASETTSATYNYVLAKPTFDPPGGVYTSSQSIAISSMIPGSVIRYTVNGDEPSETSLAYTVPIQITENTTLKAKAFKSGWYESSTARTQFVFVSNTGSIYLISIVATLTGEGYVNLSWLTQSESQMAGYRVYRNTSAEPNSSYMIDHPMIPATNTNNIQTYTIIDNDVEIGATYYYWLEAVDYNSSNFYGPASTTVE